MLRVALHAAAASDPAAAVAAAHDSAFAAQLPAAPALALAALHDTVGAALLPWLSSGVALLDAPTCQARRGYHYGLWFSNKLNKLA
jgi:hypothetical protein